MDRRSFIADATFQFYGQNCAERFYYATLQKSEMKELAMANTKDNRYIKWNQHRFWWWMRLLMYSVVFAPLALVAITLAYIQLWLVYWYNLKVLRYLADLSGQAIKKL